MTPEDLQDNKIMIIEDIEKLLTEIKNEKNPGFFLNTTDLLHKVGALESILIWQFDLNRDPTAKEIPNRLCECYEKDDFKIIWEEQK